MSHNLTNSIIPTYANDRKMKVDIQFPIYSPISINSIIMLEN